MARKKNEYNWNNYLAVKGGKIGNTQVVSNGSNYGVRSLITGKVFGAGYTKAEATALAKRYLGKSNISSTGGVNRSRGGSGSTAG